MTDADARRLCFRCLTEVSRHQINHPAPLCSECRDKESQ